MTPIRASIVGPSFSATRISASLEACHSAASCSAFGSFVMYLRARGSDYRRFAAHHNHNRNQRNQPQPSVLGVAWTRDAGRQSISSRICQTCLRQPKFGVREMGSQIVMDRTGDTRHIFDNQDRAEVAKAERRFRELTGAGFTAAVRSGQGEQRIIRSFDPTAEETLFYPRLVGG